jgi:hypothetical protein
MPDAPSVEGEGPLAVFGPDGQLAALAALRNGRLFPTLVLGPSS